MDGFCVKVSIIELPKQLQGSLLSDMKWRVRASKMAHDGKGLIAQSSNPASVLRPTGLGQLSPHTCSGTHNCPPKTNKCM